MGKENSLKIHYRRNKKVLQPVLYGVISLIIMYISLNLYNGFVFSYGRNHDVMQGVLDGINQALSFKFPDITVKGLLFGCMMIFSYFVLLIYMDASKLNTRPGEEHGSSRKGDVYSEAYILNALQNPVPERRLDDANIILSKNIKLDIDTWHTRLNNNIFVVGGSGSGKTRFFVKPNILQKYCNYVVIDPKGSVAIETGKAFEEDGYDVKYLNFVDMEKSMGYNPFEYFKKPTDIQLFVKNLVDNTSDPLKSGGDEFFTKAEITWLTACIFLVMSECQGTDMMNMNTVLMLLDNSEAKEEDGADDFESETDIIFRELEEEHRRSTGGRSGYTYRDLAIKNYKIFKLASGKTAKSILVSIGVRLSVFNLPELQRILSKDEVHLERIGEPLVKSLDKPDDINYDIDRKTYEAIEEGNYEKLDKNRLRKSILFIVISDDNSTFGFMASIVLQQLYSILYYTADSRTDNKLPIHTRFINDEFANCGKQPDFNRKISTMRSREISTAVIVQGISQIKSKSLYGDDWEAIFENCDTTLFLGSKGPTTQKIISELSGKETITHVTHSVTKGSSYSHTTGEQISGKPVFDIGDIAMLPNTQCLVHIRGHHIYEDKKYDVMEHKRVNQTMDATDKQLALENKFDVSTYCERARIVEQNRRKYKIKYSLKESLLTEEEIEGLTRGEISGSGDSFKESEGVYLTEKELNEITQTIEEAEVLDLAMLQSDEEIVNVPQDEDEGLNDESNE